MNAHTIDMLTGLVLFLAIAPLAWVALRAVDRAVELSFATLALVREYWSTDARIRRAMVAADTDPDADI